MRLIAIRTYELDGIACVDRLFQKGPNADSFALALSAFEDDPDEWRLITADQAGEWLASCPKQIILSKGITWA